MYGTVFYQNHINVIGGIETFLFELARLANINHRDLTIVYRTGDHEQIERIRHYCPIYSLADMPKPIKCRRAFFNYMLDAIDDFEAEEYIEVVHADFKDKSLKNFPPPVNSKLTKILAVSKNNAKSWEELTGITPEVVYNPITIDEEPRIMTLLAAQRFTQEKGETRVRKLIATLDDYEIPYVFHVFTDRKVDFNSPNVMYHKSTLEIRRWIKYADYMVILSDTEGFCYTGYESLCLGTPLIITRLPILDELGVNDGNSIVLDFDMHNLDVRDIYRRSGNFKFDYKKKPDKWTGLLLGEANYKYEQPEKVAIQVLKVYFDIIENRWTKPLEMYNTTPERAKTIVKSGYARYV